LSHAADRRAVWATAWRPSPAALRPVRTRGGARSARPWRGHRVRDDTVVYLPTAARCTLRAPATLQDDAEQGGRGWHVPERRGDGEAEERLRTSVFTGGEGASMGGDGGCGVLQHQSGRGKRDLAPIWKWRSSKGAHRRGGRQRRRSVKSNARERPPVAGGSGPGAGMVGREVVLERGGRSGVGDEGVDEWWVGRVFWSELGRRRG
jgi:hypothetical protein